MAKIANLIVCCAAWALCSSIASGQSAVTRDDVEAAKNEIDLRVYQSLSDLLVQQKEAEARRAIAEAEKAEALARLPATEIKALAGSVNADKFGAAGLVKAFDLAQELALHVCSTTAAFGTLAIYDPGAVQGVVGARIVDRELASTARQLDDARSALDAAIAGGRRIPMSIAPGLALDLATGTVKAAADFASLFKTNVTATGAGFGESSRTLFATSLAEQCPAQISGLGAGYLGELDAARYDELRARLMAVLESRHRFAERINAAKRLAAAEKTEPRKSELADAVSSASAMLKTVDALIDALKANDISERSPLYNAARYLAYGTRTANASILDFDLRLDGITITHENIFTGERLRLSGVAFLSYRVFRPDGTLLKAEALRRITPPIEVDLRGKDADGEFWNGPPKRARP